MELSAERYLRSLIGKFYKIRPMRQNDDATLQVYLASFIVDLEGSLYTFPSLREDSRYITVVNIAHWLNSNSFNCDEARREVEKAIDLIKKILTDAG